MGSLCAQQTKHKEKTTNPKICWFDLAGGMLLLLLPLMVEKEVSKDVEFLLFFLVVVVWFWFLL